MTEKQDVWSFAKGGTVVVTWPPETSPEELNDLKSWMEIVTRKMARTRINESGHRETRPQEGR